MNPGKVLQRKRAVEGGCKDPIRSSANCGWVLSAAVSQRRPLRGLRPPPASRARHCRAPARLVPLRTALSSARTRLRAPECPPNQGAGIPKAKDSLKGQRLGATDGSRANYPLRTWNWEWPCRGCRAERARSSQQKQMLLFPRCPLLGAGASSPLRVRCHFWVQPNHAGSRAALEIARFKLGIPQQIPHQGGCSKGPRTPPHIATSACSWPRRARRMKSVTWALCQLGTCTALSRLDFCCMPWGFCFVFKCSFPDWNQAQCKRDTRLLKLSTKSAC